MSPALDMAALDTAQLLARGLAGGVAAWSGLLLGAALTGAWRASRLLSAPLPVVEGPRPVVLFVRPVSGADPWLDRALLSILSARRSFPLRVLVTMIDADDPARPIAERCCATLRDAGLDARVLVTGAVGPNRKASQLAVAVATEPCALTLAADGDVDLSGLDLDALVLPLLAEPELCALWAPPIERSPSAGPGAGAEGRAGDRLSSALLGASLHAFPLLCGLDPRGLVGKLFCFKTKVLYRQQGLFSLVDVLGEDMALAEKLAAGGYRVRAAALLAPTLARGRSPGEVVARWSRWLQVIRGQRPGLLWSYPAMFVATPLLLLVCAVAAFAAPGAAALAASFAVVVRLLTAGLARWLSGQPTGAPLSDAIMADLTLTLAFLSMLRSRSFTWRGARLQIGPDGRLLEADR